MEHRQWVELYAMCPKPIQWLASILLKVVPTMRTGRGMLKELYRLHPQVGVEIGISTGVNALTMLKMFSLSRLFLVDPYQFYKGIDKRGAWKHARQCAAKSLEPYNVTFIFKQASEAVDEIPNNLDFVYIDGNHNYEFVKQDIANYYPKVREGGLLGGHDYIPLHPGVIKAVNEFGLPVHCGTEGDWWFVKEG